MFRELFERAPDAMIVVDPTGHIVRANPQAERLFGYTEHELLDQAIEILLPEHARNAHHAHRDSYMANPRVRPMGSGQELTGLKRSGQEFPVEIALSPINAPEGRLFLASIRDISETQRARQAIARARYDAVSAQLGQHALASPELDVALEHATNLIAEALSAEAVAIIFRQPQSPQIQVRAAFGVQPELLEGLAWTTIMPAQRRQGAAAPHTVDGPIILEGEALAGTGFAATLVFPLMDLGEPMGALLALTRQKRHFDRDALHFLQSSANLLASAMQRARTEEQLSHAQRLEAVGQLTGGVAHDFNNLLTVISGNLQILEDEVADRPSAREIISSALRAVGRGAELTRKLLAFAGRLRLAPRATEPGKLLGELGSMLRRTLGETINLEISCPPEIPEVFVDAGQLDNALVNLALNSRDAMPRGGDLIISARREQVGETEAGGELAPGDYVVFSVRDSGLGMPPDVLARAFEPFFTTKDQGKGSGLGLSMVYGFVKQSGGHLTVESQLGYGTRFDLHLPAVKAQPGETAAPTTRSAPRGSESILVVEDEVDVRDIAVTFLRSLGYVVIATADAAAALEQLSEHDDIDMLFSDVVLGTGMTGVELAHEARRRRPDLPVLLTSGYEHSALETGASKAREFVLLQKPYRREDLSAAVRRILDRR
jgi:PAS domain S-box-containing protein